MERFWKKVKRSTPDRCWLWTAATDDNGYGAFKINGHKRGAHVIAYELCVGVVPSNHVVMHSCDNRCCVNPAHLETGTQLDNIRDMDLKGRRAVGSAAGAAKLTEEIVPQIRLRFEKEDISKRQLAREYGIHEKTMRDLLNRRTWKHV
jgi:hypothetical protein